jgi:hypothetical protein
MTAQSDNTSANADDPYTEWDLPRLAARVRELEAAIAEIAPDDPTLDRARN